MMNRYTSIRRNESGMVAIIVTMILMIVISLIVLGFAQVSRREQRQSLDRSLSTQAFFAAESGVNDAMKIIREADPGTNVEKTTCSVPGTNAYARLQPVINATNNVAYTCMLVTTTGLRDIIDTVPADGSSTVFPIHPTTGSLSALHINWALPDAPSSVAGCNKPLGTFSRSGGSDWTCPYGVLRVDLVPTDTLQRNSLNFAQRTVFFYPVNGSSSGVSYASADGSVRAMSCTTTRCSADITGISGSINYSMRAMAIYNPGTITITATNSFGTAVTLKDAQAQIDVTGRSQDVLRRIQVRMSLTPSNNVSNYAIDSASAICKRFEVGANVFRVPGDIAVNDNTNPMCRV